MLDDAGKSWEDVYMDLCIIGCEQGRMPNNTKVYGEYGRIYDTWNCGNRKVGIYYIKKGA